MYNNNPIEKNLMRNHEKLYENHHRKQPANKICDALIIFHPDLNRGYETAVSFA